MHPHTDPEGPGGCPAGAARTSSRRLRPVRMALALTGIMFVAEAAGGWLTGSLALLADAGHMLSDIAALGLSLWAIWFASRPAPAHRTYGNHRAEILAALVNGVTLVVIALLVFREAYDRFSAPRPIDSGPMLLIATIGLGVNLGSAWILHRGGATGGHDHDHDHDHDGHGGHDHHSGGEDLNLKGAYLHVLGDALGSVGAIGAGVVIHLWGYEIADPIASVAIGLLILLSSGRLVLRSVDVLLESAPSHLDVEAIRGAIEGVAGVTRILDLHVWTITSGLLVLTLHAAVQEGADRDGLARTIRERILTDYGIEHVTIELEGKTTGPFKERHP